MKQASGPSPPKSSDKKEIVWTRISQGGEQLGNLHELPDDGFDKSAANAQRFRIHHPLFWLLELGNGGRKNHSGLRILPFAGKIRRAIPAHAAPSTPS